MLKDIIMGDVCEVSNATLSVCNSTDAHLTQKGLIGIIEYFRSSEEAIKDYYDVSTQNFTA